MSDVIARMRLESQDFDNKLKSATANLQHMEREVRRTGATFEYADKEEVEFLRSLGSMETKAMDAKGKIKELSNSYKELAMMYDRMSEAEKKGSGGRALAGSLEQLKTRLNDTKASLANVSKDIGEGGGGGLSGALETLGSKIGIPAGAFTALGGAMAAGAAAAKVAKDAFLATEGGMDTWGAAVESAKGAYSVFLNTLNNGNWGSFFTNLKNAISGANDLYDAMDRLGSIKANNAAAIAKEQATIQELRLRQQKGENVAAELRAAEERLRKLQNESVEQGKVAGVEQMKQTLTNSVNSIKGNGGLFRKDTTAKVTEQDIDAAIKDILANGQAAMDKYAEQYSKLTEKATKTVTETRYSQGGQAYQVTTKSFDINVLSAEEQALYKLSKAVTDSETALQQGIGTYAQSLQEGASSNREAFQTERFAQKGDRQAAKVPVEPVLPEGSIAKLQDELKKAQEKFNLAGTDEDRAAAKKSIDEITASIEKLQGKTKETAQEGSIAYMRQQLQELQRQWELAADPATREELKKQIGEVSTALGEMEGKNKQATSALSMWGDHQAKIDETMNLLRQFYTMMDDPNIGEGQREWAAQMAESYKAQLDEMMGATDTAVATMQDSLNNLSSGVGAISTLGNSLNELKGIGEDLASAFSGEMDAWDALMTVFNSGIGIMQTVIGVMEAINTLQELSAALSKKKVVEQAAETTAVVSGKGAEMAAETAEAAASGTATAANTAEAAAGAGKAMAGIPVVGPALAIAAIAAVLAAVLAATSKAKSAKGYAFGGMVEGTSYSGDNIVARLNAGEGVLTQTGVRTAAAMADGMAGAQRVVVEGRISGKDILLSANNTNRAAGGSRGYYTKVK